MEGSYIMSRRQGVTVIILCENQRGETTEEHEKNDFDGPGELPISGGLWCQ
jgi:hypothetical protein